MRLAATLAFAVVACSEMRASADQLSAGEASKLKMNPDFVVGLKQPTAMAVLPDGRMVITERQGGVKVRTTAGKLVEAGTIPVNASWGELGLLNVLPHPDFNANKKLFVYFSADDSMGGTGKNRHRLATIELGADNKLKLDTIKVLLQNLEGPSNHNGGGLTILGDKIFVGVGDSGHNSNAPVNSPITNYFGTCLTNGNGKVLRVNLDGSIPADNPLQGKSVSACKAPNQAPSEQSKSPRTEIWAWGLRNPFRIWGDPKTGNVWVGDVGEITYEEIDVIPKSGGKHFGWPYREGAEGKPKTSCKSIAPDVGECVDPVYYCEANGHNTPDNPAIPNDCESMTGGRILDHCSWPASLRGSYVFGDFTTQKVWTLPVNPSRDGVVGQRRELMTTDAGGPVQFVEHEGSLYVVVHSDKGRIVQVSPRTASDACAPIGPPPPPKAAPPPKK